MPQFVSTGSAGSGLLRLFVNYRLKDGHLYQYKHKAGPSVSISNIKTLLTTGTPSLQNPLVKGELYNFAVPPTAIDIFQLD